MSDKEYQDKQELNAEVQEKLGELQTLGEEQKDHQEDIEKLQETLRLLKINRGSFKSSDAKMQRDLNEAIKTRETSVETCKEKLREVGNKMESIRENAKQIRTIGENRVRVMERVEISLHYRSERIIETFRNDIEIQKEENQEVNQTENKLKNAIGILQTLLTTAGAAAAGIATLLNALKDIGLFR